MKYCGGYYLYYIVQWGVNVSKCSSHLEQLDTSMVGPSQFLPPHREAGLSHDLERHRQELTPSTPSSLLHGCHAAQDPKPPLVVWFRSWNWQDPGTKWEQQIPRFLSEGDLWFIVWGWTFPSALEEIIWKHVHSRQIHSYLCYCISNHLHIFTI